jgi:hypothetical protein
LRNREDSNIGRESYKKGWGAGIEKKRKEDNNNGK